MSGGSVYQHSICLSVVQRLGMNAADFTTQLHDIKVCFFTTLIILCISFRLGIAVYSSWFSSTSSFLNATPVPRLIRVGRFACTGLVLQQSRVCPPKILIRFLFHPILTIVMWLFFVGVCIGFDDVSISSATAYLLPTICPPFRLCLLVVWISWFVGLVWTLHQSGPCFDDRGNQASFVCVRKRSAKLINGHLYFISSRYKRPSFAPFSRCNRNGQAQPVSSCHVFPETYPKRISDNSLHYYDRFLQRCCFGMTFFTFQGSIRCIRKGVRVQSDFLRLITSLYICQIQRFAFNWMILTSFARTEWLRQFPYEHYPFYGWIKSATLCSFCDATPGCGWSHHRTYGVHQLPARMRKIKRSRYHCGPTCDRNWSSSFYNPFCGVRVGEAKNPGPVDRCSLDFGTFNPTQLLHKEDDIQQWGQGIYTSCETSVTPVAYQILNQKFRKAGWSTRWSKFVDPQQPKVSQIRGRAAGTAILSTFPLRPYVEPCPELLTNSDRFCDGVVQVSCNTNIYVSVMYGFPIANAYLNALQMNNDLFSPIAERALNFQGPAIISGDFNCDLKDLIAWRTLQNAGWKDAALLDCQLHNRAPQPTCREATRRSFILVNPIVASKILECRTCEDYIFSSHPLLLAKLDFHCLIQPQIHWSLPKATDDLLFDAVCQEEQVQADLQQWGHKFNRAIDSQDANKAATLFSRLVQNSWVASHVDVEGNPQYTQPGYLGRDNIKLLQSKPCSIPIVHKGREGAFEPCCGQASVGIRQHTRQLRRLESLVLQVKAKNKHHLTCLGQNAPIDQFGAVSKCQELWEAILHAKGFHKSFAWWIGHSLGWFVPQICPHIEYLVALKDFFYKWHNAELHRYVLHRQKVRRVSVALDTLKGGRLAFQELRDPPCAPLSFLTETVCNQVVKAKWSKAGLTNIKLVKDLNFDPLCPVHFQGQTSWIRHQDKLKLVVHPPLKLRNNDMEIFQYNATANPDHLHAKVANAWNQHWCRDAPLSDDSDTWLDIGPVLERLPDIPPKAFVPFSLDIWAKHCKGLNKRSSRGGCGYSVCEMQSFPPILVMQLFRIYEAIEKGMQWPTNWVTAKVSMLSKCENPKSPFDARPITVFGVLYRQWSRIRSRELLQYMASFMPVEIAASTKGISADAVAGLITHIAETAINQNGSICGVGIDLTRCFNTLPRHPLVLAFKKLGIPQEYINAWKSMLGNMTRTLTISNCQGPLLHSTTGAPEGCGMSVAAMACITFWCGRHILHHVPIARPICYADNWNILAHIPKDLLRAVEHLVEFVDLLRLAINPKKSWFWATRPSHRKNLVGTRVGDCVLPVLCNTSDLGCDLHYSQKVHKPLTKKRWAKAKRVCNRVARSKAPKGFKRRLTKGAGISAASFGLSIQDIPKTQWRILRTSVTRALGLCGAGASPWLALATCGLDPQLGNAITVCRFWRKFLISFPEQRPDFASNLLQVGKSKIGPVANFRKTLQVLGWDFTHSDCIFHQKSGVHLQWRTCSNKHLAFVLQKCWPWTVVDKSPERKDWDRQVFDIPMFMKLVQSRNPRHMAFLQGFVSGKHFTNDIIHKYDKNVTPSCPLCGSSDSKDHRLFHCETFKSLRVTHCKTIHWASKQKDSLKFFGLPSIQPTIWDKIRVICTADVPWQHPPMNTDPVHLFLDGSAFGQDRKELTISSWSVVSAKYLDDNFAVIASGFTPTWEHSSFRGEVAAILGALQTHSKCHLYSDCQAAVDIFTTLLDFRRHGGFFPSLDHSDLWHPIWELLVLQAATVTITKVSAHKDPATIADPLTKWFAIGNNFADQQAKQVILSHPIHREIVRLGKRYDTEFSRCNDFHNFICEVAEETYSVCKSTRPKVTSTESSGFQLPDFSQWGPRSAYVHCDLPAYDSLQLECPFGKTFYERFRSWFNQLQWPTVEHTCIPVSFVGMVELYFDFVMVTGTETPINVGSRQNVQWRLLDEHPLLQSPPIPLARHTQVWVVFWKWCWKYLDVVFPYRWLERRPLSHLGYSLLASCISHRPKLVCGSSSLALWRYFHPLNGRRRNFNEPLRPLPKPGSV